MQQDNSRRSVYLITRVPSILPSLSAMYPYTLFLLFHWRTSPLTVLALSASELLAVVLADKSAPESVTGGVWFQRATRPATRSDMGLARRLRAVTSWVFLRSTSSCCLFWDSSARIWYWCCRVWGGGVIKVSASFTVYRHLMSYVNFTSVPKLRLLLFEQTAHKVLIKKGFKS